MVTIIRPHGAIVESLITSISETAEGKFYVYDRASNKLETTKEEYSRLLRKGVESRDDYIRRIKISQLQEH